MREWGPVGRLWDRVGTAFHSGAPPRQVKIHALHRQGSIMRERPHSPPLPLPSSPSPSSPSSPPTREQLWGTDSTRSARRRNGAAHSPTWPPPSVVRRTLPHAHPPPALAGRAAACSVPRARWAAAGPQRGRSRRHRRCPGDEPQPAIRAPTCNRTLSGSEKVGTRSGMDFFRSLYQKNLCRHWSRPILEPFCQLLAEMTAGSFKNLSKLTYCDL